MILKLIYMFFVGTVDIVVEGFFIERFINICRQENIFLWKLKLNNESMLMAKISKSDFKKIRHIAKKTSCRINLNGKEGLPFLMKKYKKRKWFAITICVIAIFSFIVTRFIWNIEVVGNERISKEEIIENLAEYGVKQGVLKYGINLEEIKNDIRLKRNDLAWIGIEIRGTNVITTVVEATEKEDIVDKNIPTDIIANKSGTVSKIIVRNRNSNGKCTEIKYP